MIITTATQNNFTLAVRLLEQNNLPTSDLTASTKLFLLEEGNDVLGTIALEHEGTEGLLRSLCVSEKSRNTGVGQKLVEFIEDYARQQGVENLYLLTTTAANFFSNRGYGVTDRAEVSSFIATTSEFSSVCPSSATVMLKKI